MFIVSQGCVTEKVSLNCTFSRRSIRKVKEQSIVEVKERLIAEALKAHKSSMHPVGETLQESVRVRRVKVKISLGQEFLCQEPALCVIYSTTLTLFANLCQLILFILHEEITSIKIEIDGWPILIIFNGTTHVCEAMVVVVGRFMDSNWCIKHFCHLMLLQKSYRRRGCSSDNKYHLYRGWHFIIMSGP